MRLGRLTRTLLKASGISILVPRLDVEAGTIRHFDGRESEAVGILVHEAVHTFVQRRLGVLRVWRLA